MSTEAKQAHPSPELFFETANAFQRTAALKAAIELDLFTAIGASGPGQATPATVAAKCGASEKGIRVLCDFLTVVGFLTKSGKSYALTPDAAAFLDRRSPGYIASATEFLNSPLIMQHYSDVTAVVRKGGTASTQSIIAPENPIWVEFARAMAPMMSMPAELISRQLNAEAAPKWKVLDIAAGHGLFGVTLAVKNKNAEVTAVDWPNVLELAKANATKAGLQNRYRTLPGDAFQVDYGTGYDIVLLTNFLHTSTWPRMKVCCARCTRRWLPVGGLSHWSLCPTTTGSHPARWPRLR